MNQRSAFCFRFIHEAKVKVWHLWSKKSCFVTTENYLLGQQCSVSTFNLWWAFLCLKHGEFFPWKMRFSAMCEKLWLCLCCWPDIFSKLQLRKKFSDYLHPFFQMNINLQVSKSASKSDIQGARRETRLETYQAMLWLREIYWLLSRQKISKLRIFPTLHSSVKLDLNHHEAGNFELSLNSKTKLRKSKKPNNTL